MSDKERLLALLKDFGVPFELVMDADDEVWIYETENGPTAIFGFDQQGAFRNWTVES